MILYFSGTGNSRYVAERIAAVTEDRLVSINAKIKNHDDRKLDCSDRLVFVVPTYAWRIPKIVEEWILHTEFGCGKAWFVMTCGSEIGDAGPYNQRLCEQKRFTYMGTVQILMPENYIAMFNAPTWSEAETIIEKAEPVIQKAGEEIKAGKAFSLLEKTVMDRLKSTFVNPIFYKMSVKADAFTANESCISCAKCVANCPLNNIRLIDGKPVWGKNCTHCMACICGCPKEAIEYGKKSIGKPRYQCRKEVCL